MKDSCLIQANGRIVFVVRVDVTEKVAGHIEDKQRTRRGETDKESGWHIVIAKTEKLDRTDRQRKKLRKVAGNIEKFLAKARKVGNEKLCTNNLIVVG